MKKIILILVTILTITSTVFAHGGRTDSCGGHNDRKRGGYHIHNLSKYCKCYPDSPECKNQKDDSIKTNPKKSKK